jgi:hypothetical protein
LGLAPELRDSTPLAGAVSSSRFRGDKSVRAAHIDLSRKRERGKPVSFLGGNANGISFLGVVGVLGERALLAGASGSNGFFLS